ncbi:MAG: hypothetical protein IPM48_04810 [Saprospiraceae bacterium]|nr:hypothetical protein [Saprospiraceae bacterium]
MKSSSSIFQRFKQLPDKGYYDQLAYFSYYFKEIKTLPFHEYIQIKLGYLSALYHLEKNKAFDITAEQMILEIINHETFDEELKSVYKEVLMLKAKYQIDQKRLKDGIRIYSDLNRIDKSDIAIKRILFGLYFQNNLISFRKYFGMVVVLVLLTLLLVYIDAMVIRAAFPQWQSIWKILYISFFGFSLIITGSIFFISLQRSRSKLEKNNHEKDV